MSVFEAFRDAVIRADGSVSPVGLIATVITLAVVAIFYRMATNSLNDRRDSPEGIREAQRRDKRAETLAAEARRELAAKNQAE